MGENRSHVQSHIYTCKGNEQLLDCDTITIAINNCSLFIIAKFGFYVKNDPMQHNNIGIIR